MFQAFLETFPTYNTYFKGQKTWKEVSEVHIQCQSAAKYLWSQDSLRNTASTSARLANLVQLIWFVFTCKNTILFWVFFRDIFSFCLALKYRVFNDVHPFQFASQEHFLRRGYLVPRKQNIYLVLLLADKAKRWAACQTLHPSSLLAAQQHTEQSSSWVKGHPSSLELPVLNLLRHSSFLHPFCIFNLSLAICPNEIQNPVT